MIVRLLLALSGALLLAACGAREEGSPPKPALWEVTGPKGERGWLFGTIHALPDGMTWRTAKLDKALAQSDRLVLEIATLDDRARLEATFEALGRSPGHPPLSQRVAKKNRPALARLLDGAGMEDGDFRGIETWAAALILAQSANRNRSDNGVDRALIALEQGKPVLELEGARRQLGVFDALPEQDQRDLLDAVLADAGKMEANERQLTRYWRDGNMIAITRETKTGMLADKELREALLVGRNRAWAGRVETMLAKGWKPFVAVGAAHLAGPDGLPAMLEKKGWKVKRVQ